MNPTDARLFREMLTFVSAGYRVQWWCDGNPLDGNVFYSVSVCLEKPGKPEHSARGVARLPGEAWDLMKAHLVRPR